MRRHVKLRERPGRHRWRACCGAPRATPGGRPWDSRGSSARREARAHGAGPAQGLWRRGPCAGRGGAGPGVTAPAWQVIFVSSCYKPTLYTTLRAPGARLHGGHRAADGLHGHPRPPGRGRLRRLGRAGGRHGHHVRQRDGVQPPGHRVPQAGARARRAPALGAAGARKMPLRALPGAARAPGGACGARQQPCAWQDARTDKAVHGRDSGRVLACSLWSRQSPAMPLARTRLAGAPADARARAARPRRWRA